VRGKSEDNIFDMANIFKNHILFVFLIYLRTTNLNYPARLTVGGGRGGSSESSRPLVNMRSQWRILDVILQFLIIAPCTPHYSHSYRVHFNDMVFTSNMSKNSNILSSKRQFFGTA